MKLLLVLGSDDNYDIISKNTKSLGFDMIRYRHVLKAMDNIDEIDPSAIIISARDFPRHWKILVQFIRHERSKEACPIVILKGEKFSTEETSKAYFMGVNGIINDTLSHQEDIDRLNNIFGRSSSPEKQKNGMFIEPWHRIGLIIADLSGKAIVTGDVKSISANGLTFTPASPQILKTVPVKKELKECSLRIGEVILSPNCRVTDAGKTISLEFISFPGNEQRMLDRYLREFMVQESGIDKAC